MGVVVSPLHTAAARVPPVGGPSHLTLIDGRTFAISDRRGDIVGGAEGLVHHDRRHVSRLSVLIDDEPLVPIADATPSPFSALVVHRPRDADGVERPALLVRRRRLDAGLRDELELWATGHHPVTATISVTVGADFAHIFDVKDGHGRPPVAPRVVVDGFDLVAPDRTAATNVRWQPPATEVSLDGEVRWTLRVEPGRRAAVSITAVPVDPRDETAVSDVHARDAGSEPVVVSRLPSWQASMPKVTSTDARLTTSVRQALADLAALRIQDVDHPDRIVIAAGAPWFMTLFGRDSLLTTWMTLPFDSALVAGVLETLAGLQGSTDDPIAEEEPGKILHELRNRGGGGPFSVRERYFGSVDATPLFVATAAEARRWGALDDRTLRLIGPAIERAVGWVEHNCGDGFVSYSRRDERGLVNQGWKDSWDGVTFADGTRPAAPIALVEVQGYAYAALHGAAELAEAVPLSLDAAELRRRAEHLKDRFNDVFWDERGWYALALDGQGRRVDSLTTNPGHACWAGIAAPDLADRYLDRLAESRLWSGWGLRTLADDMGAFDPLSYHNGSVWPHDTAICAAGAARYGRWDIVDLIVDGALDAAEEHDGRPPELFAGIARDDVPVPVAYPASCSPQAWSSASILLLVRAMLGLSASIDGLALDRPDLAPLGDLTVDGLHHHDRLTRLVIHNGTAVWHDRPAPTS
jgi:glycogen debranching enzyme